MERDQHPPGGILAFYLGQYPDNRGRKIEDIWQWNYQQLEVVHNYIQWLFPLREKSRFNPDAPLLTEPVIAAFNESEELQKRLRKSLEIMLKLYGLECQESETPKIVKSGEYSTRKKAWINYRNHNYLRLTRILTSLTLLGLKKYAQALMNCLEEIYQEEGKNIGQETYSYWQNAIQP